MPGSKAVQFKAEKIKKLTDCFVNYKTSIKTYY